MIITRLATVLITGIALIYKEIFKAIKYFSYSSEGKFKLQLTYFDAKLLI
jgi:hypothetical protein